MKLHSFHNYILFVVLILFHSGYILICINRHFIFVKKYIIFTLLMMDKISHSRQNSQKSLTPYNPESYFFVKLKYFPSIFLLKCLCPSSPITSKSERNKVKKFLAIQFPKPVTEGLHQNSNRVSCP